MLCRACSPFAGLDRSVLGACHSASDQPGQPHPGASVAGLDHRSCDSSSETISPFTSAKVFHRKYAFTFKILLALFFSNKHRKYLSQTSIFILVSCYLSSDTFE